MKQRLHSTAMIGRKLTARSLQQSLPRLVSRKQSSALTTEEFTSLHRSIPSRELSLVQLRSFEAMKALVDTLHAALISPYSRISPPTNDLEFNSHEGSVQRLLQEDVVVTVMGVPLRDEIDASEPASELEDLECSDDVVMKGADVLIDNHESGSESKSEKKNAIADNKKALKRTIVTLMNQNDTKAVCRALRQASSKSIVLPKKFLYNCYRFMLTRNPVYSYDILCLYQQQYDVTDDMYERICRSVAIIQGNHESPYRVSQMIQRLLQDLEALPREKQQILLPYLLESLLSTTVASARRYSLDLYNHLCNQEFDLSTNLMESLLEKSRYYSDKDFPFHDVLRRLSESPDKLSSSYGICQVLANYFPFSDVQSTQIAVKAILEIVRNGDTNICVDRGTLEQILASAARVGNHELGLSIWDLVESLGYEPTESLFESMIQSFSMSYRQDHRAFACMAAMEDYGYIPSRALLRSVSRSLRYSINRVDNAYGMIVSEFSGCRPTLSSFNAIMSACAECGDVDRTFSVLLDDFKAYGFEPNQDSFSFAMLALAVEAQLENPTLEKDARVQAAEDLLNMMASLGVEIDHSVFHSYIRVLVNSDKMDLANQSTLDAIKMGSVQVDNKTIVLLVRLNCVMAGNFGVARELAKLTSEPFPFLAARIDRYEKSASQEK